MDGGASWTTALPGANKIFRVDLTHEPGSPASLFAVSYDSEEALRSDDGGATFYRVPIPGTGKLMSYGTSADKLAVVSEPGSRGYAAGMYKFDARVSGGFPWIKISPDGLAQIGPGCQQLVGQIATTEVKPYPMFAMGQRACGGDYPIARYGGRF
jgi:hypothetical protein